MSAERLGYQVSPNSSLAKQFINRQNLKGQLTLVEGIAYEKYGQQEIELLLALDADLDEPDGFGYTPLAQAMVKGMLGMGNFFVEQHANVNVVNQY